jgi:hypothetical protein
MYRKSKIIRLYQQFIAEASESSHQLWIKQFIAEASESSHQLWIKQV